MKHRFYQPKNSKDAMRFMETLFNKYRNAPLTKPLLQYHEKLMFQIHDNVLPVAKKEGVPDRIKSARRMYKIMRRWITIRMSGHAFQGKMRHFKIDNHHHKFKARHIKINNGTNYRSSQH
ncbi:MAG: hypothetical protein AJITA_00181 [Acetilactobacillus jinshanensis]